VLISSVYLLWPPKDKINLGLDLKGGAQFILKVKAEEAVDTELVNRQHEIERLLIKRGIPIGSARVEDGKLSLFFATPDQRKDALDIILKDDIYTFYSPKPSQTAEGSGIELQIPVNRAKEIETEIFDQAIQTIRNRIDEFGLREPVVQRQGISGNRILVQLPGFDENDLGRAEDVVTKTAFLQFMIVKSGPASKDALLRSTNGKVPSDSELVPSATTEAGQILYYLLDKKSAVPGSDLEDARISSDQYGLPAVSFTFNSSGARQFGELTGSNIGSQLAIVLDGKVHSAPVVQSKISRNGQITGRFTSEEARVLAVVLRAGALPAPVEFQEKRIVSASLGEDSIRRGIRSGLLGSAIVIVFMILYYKTAGVIADLALILNIVILMGTLAAFHATLTMPGIAGIVLTIGMAVDANVLIYERVREELRQQKTIRNAISQGYARAFWTIFDSNVTTLIAGFVLLNFGAGPIKGFAITLVIGIFASMFTALFVTRVIFDLLLLRRNVKRIAI